MTKQKFLSENRERVIKFYNNEVRGLHNVSLKDFMIDLMNNWTKVTKQEIAGFTLTDLAANLTEAKSRLGLMDAEINTVYTRPYSQSNHAKMANYYGEKKANQLLNI